MTSETNTPETMLEAIKYFADYGNAHRFMVSIRWPDGVVKCPTCGSCRVRYIATRRQWECREKHPQKRFSLKTGTIMEQSPLPLEKWLACYWYEVNCKNSVSSYEIMRELGVTQKTGWFMLHRIRHALHVGSWDSKMNGVVEADETMVGGLAANMHKKVRERKVGRNRGGTHMTNVMGLLQRHDGKKHSTVRTKVLRDRKKESLLTVIHKNVEPGTTLYTDALKNYRDPSIVGSFNYDFVDHAEAYVKDKVVHTNGLENFWALFKRCIKGTHVSVDPQHLFRYVDSEAFRFNYREVENSDRFRIIASNTIGKRLTYKTLIRASEDSLGNQLGI
jgi:transposase-like protein